MSARRRLLYISPIMPALGGNGLAMRGGMMLEALAADCDVWLLVIPVAGSVGGLPPAPIARWCAGFHSLPINAPLAPAPRGLPGCRSAGESPLRPVLARFATPTVVRAARRVFGSQTFDEVHVFRLYMAPFADPYLSVGAGRRPICALDVDDYESRTRERLAALHAAAGDGRSAMHEIAEATRYRAMERHYLPLFERVYVCSGKDRTAVARSGVEARLSVVPNGVRIPAEAPPVRRTNRPFTVLFVGNLSYYPNEDAVVFLCTEILARIRAATRRSVRALIVGGGAGPAVRALARRPGVMVAGPVTDLAGCYATADVAVVPVRAGGGSRIKLLEALAYACPVVSTSVGAEGIVVRHGSELLIADGAADFAAACARVLERPGPVRAMVRRGRDFVERRHSPAAVLRRLRAARRLTSDDRQACPP